MNGRSHYDVLGLRDDASSEAIREQYRRLAREFHPDRAVGSAAGSEKMPMINEAYRVLSDPGRRAMYDAERRDQTAPTTEGSLVDRDGEPGGYSYVYPEGPARVPWRSLLFFSGIAIVAIVVLAQFQRPAEPQPPDNLLRTGECVELVPDGDFANEIVCTGNGDLVVRQVVTRGGMCPDGRRSTRDRQGMVGVCLEQQPTDPSAG
ncbi:MAG: J domain-containing protein [Ilumatobacter sp.]